ncbi:hypothetical protein SISSUDRAFT_1037788 [Sistotremastrum suecicum HHB10207 ss-3]|uniref:Uncharacterized protein n=1 Tax=Sistotremastrum suecicum HHB10207 ss-3 TaxID=1314776 RepID=A0A165XNI6_9AGAM|nr:hypothetical protein SISSUDRAFT_1037788 [Sistotremastrum suecicum HHB10207 ss-3]
MVHNRYTNASRSSTHWKQGESLSMVPLNQPKQVDFPAYETPGIDMYFVLQRRPETAVPIANRNDGLNLLYRACVRAKFIMKMTTKSLQRMLSRSTLGTFSYVFVRIKPPYGVRRSTGAISWPKHGPDLAPRITYILSPYSRLPTHRALRDLRHSPEEA